MTTVLITGADGFIGRNLRLRLEETKRYTLHCIARQDGAEALEEAARRANFVFHLAGVNRPRTDDEFTIGNVDFTDALCAALARAGNAAPIVFTSSTQAERDNPYGRSKRAAEARLQDHATRTSAPLHLFRLPNVFGKWARPNYNSAVATFCHNVANGLPLTVHDPAAPLHLVYIDDVVEAFLRLIDQPSPGGFGQVEPVYATTVGEVARTIETFPAIRETSSVPAVGAGLCRALYSTYLTYLSPDAFAYQVPVHGADDPRGPFVEMLRTRDSGQFSYFIAHPGVTRGDHYHHTKTEKFLVITGTARFAFRHMTTNAEHELMVRGGEGTIVETIPGWTHNITNVGAEDLICMLWANEVFDRQRPDTVWNPV